LIRKELLALELFIIGSRHDAGAGSDQKPPSNPLRRMHGSQPPSFREKLL
jgi:hypothetical protein